MSEVLEKMQTRRSIRRYKFDMLPKDVIEKVVEAGTFAASGMNLQTPVIVAVTNKEIRDKMAKANAKVMGSDNDPFYGAPVVLVVLAEKKGTYVYDGSLVMGNLMLAAHELGIGSCWIHRAKEVFEQEEWKQWLKALGLKGEYEGIGNCVLGYAEDEYPGVLPRKENRVYFVE